VGQAKIALLNEHLAIGSMTAECDEQLTVDGAVVYSN